MVSVFWPLNFPVPLAEKAGKSSVVQLAALAKMGISNGRIAAIFIPISYARRFFLSVPVGSYAVILPVPGGEKGLSDGGQKMN